MQSFLSLVKNPSVAKNLTSLALGKFDGLHLGHQALFNALDSNGAVLCIEKSSGVLLPRKYRSFFSSYPMFYMHLDAVRTKSDKEFVGFLLSVLPNLKRIVVGYDFRFGKDRYYYPFDLSKVFKGEVVVISEVSYKKLSVHSGLIKELLSHGNVEMANKLLGRMYGICGKIIQGQNLGKKVLYATLNLENDGFLLPQDGVYAGYVQLGACRNPNPLYPAVIFIGNRLSTDRVFAIEGHLLGISLEAVTQEAGFYFCKKIRDNQRFEDLSLLKVQITQDIAETYKILKVQNG